MQTPLYAGDENFLRKGVIIPEVNLGLVMRGFDDLNHAYGGLLTGGSYSTGWMRTGSFGVSVAIARRVQLGLIWDYFDKRYDVGSEMVTDRWRLGAQSVAVRGRYTMLATKKSLWSWPWKNKLTQVWLGAALGRIALSGATMTSSFSPLNVKVSGSAGSVVLDVGSDIFISERFSLGSTLGYRIGKIKAIFIEGTSGGYPIPRQRKINRNGENEYLDYSGVLVNFTLKLYLGGRRNSP